MNWFHGFWFWLCYQLWVSVDALKNKLWQMLLNVLRVKWMELIAQSILIYIFSTIYFYYLLTDVLVPLSSRKLWTLHFNGKSGITLRLLLYSLFLYWNDFTNFHFWNDFFFLSIIIFAFYLLYNTLRFQNLPSVTCWEFCCICHWNLVRQGGFQSLSQLCL